jgi:hypothetical protein
VAGDDLAARLQRLEDERDIRRVMNLVWLLSDVGPAAALAALHR